MLAATIASFPVYRTYVSTDTVEITARDAGTIRAAIAAAKERCPPIDGPAFDFLEDVLTLRDPGGLTDEQRADRRDFVLRFQQLTGPVMAKGVEDTAFYRYFPLLSLDEVGGGPAPFGISIDEFHRSMRDRASRRPGALSATSTHDTKRAEDSRARLGVLSEIPAEWAAAVRGWRAIVDPLRPRLEGKPVPDADDEYYVYQTILGAWPPRGVHDDDFPGLTPRVQGAVEKAVREAKRNSSWVSPNDDYEEALRAFVARLLDPNGLFAQEMTVFAARVMTCGFLTSLAQLAIKATAPGVPDFFQGTELWDFSMVDPDNRRPVDFDRRARLLEDLGRQYHPDRTSLIRELLETPEDGRVKLFATSALLACRRQERELFAHGDYLPLTVQGSRSDHVVAFARRWRGRIAVTVTGRFFARLGGETSRAPSAGVWDDTFVQLPEEALGTELTDALSGVSRRHDEASMLVSDVFSSVPLAVLVGQVPECP